MNIKSEIDKTIAHLRDTRMAIWGKGGDINLTCGLKDLPNAIWSIPADASLAFQVDNSIAYEKIVPAKAEEYAYVSKIGGLTTQENNLCFADGHYELKDEFIFEVDLGELEAGEYTFYFVGNFTGASALLVRGNADIEPRTNVTPNITYVLTVYERDHISVWLYSIQADSDPADPETANLPLINGTFTGIMLCKASDFDKSYKPYLRTRNLCIADGRYDLTSRPATVTWQSFSLDLGELKEGIYQISLFGDFMNLENVLVAGDKVVAEVRAGDNPIDNNLVFGVTESCNVDVGLDSLANYYNYNPEERPDLCWSGEITGIMLAKLSQVCNGIEDVLATEPIANLEYKPYAQFLYTNHKVESLGSYGANLLDMDCPQSVPKGTGQGNTPKRVFTPGTYIIGVTHNNYYAPSKVTIHERAANSFTFSTNNNGAGYNVAFALKLLPNTSYYLSYERSATVTASCAFYADDGTWLTSKATGSAAGLGFTTDEYGNVLIGFTSNTDDVQVTVSNIMLNLGTKAASYKPYSAEPIDTIEIPEEVQALEGYGIGKSATECNYIDFGRKVFVNEYEVVDGVVQKRENPSEIDLTQLLPNESQFLKVEGGGSIVFNNEHKQAVPSKIKYVKRTE